MSLLLPLGIKRAGDTNLSWGAAAKAFFTTYFFVNPEKLELKREASISETRTMGGTVFQPWPNMPDQLEFSGILYGTRSVAEALILDYGIPGSPDDKRVDLIYKWRKYPGYIKSLNISADVEKPRCYNYSFTFVSTEAIKLYSLLVGQLTGTTVEGNYLAAQTSAAAISAKNDLLNVAAVAALAVFSVKSGNMSGAEMGLAASRQAILFASGAAINIGRTPGKGGNVAGGDISGNGRVIQ